LLPTLVPNQANFIEEITYIPIQSPIPLNLSRNSCAVVTYGRKEITAAEVKVGSGRKRRMHNVLLFVLQLAMYSSSYKGSEFAKSKPGGGVI
jgi:hypothetical protein